MQRNNLQTAGNVWPNLSIKTREGKPNNTGGFRGTFSSIGRITLRSEPSQPTSNLAAPQMRDAPKKPISGRRRSTSGGRSSNGNSLRSARGRGDNKGPNFNIDVPSNGYAWWYVDGIDPISGKAISIIAFIGSVFSPWYKWSGRKVPQNNVCINVATYGPGGRFTMTDRGSSALQQSEHSITIGPSSMIWDDTEKSLVISINEISSLPLVSQLKGTIVVKPKSITDVELPLTSDGTHIWRPFAPTAEIEVDLNTSGWKWSGHGYFDANFGTRALEQDFNYWTWGRFPVSKGTQCFYDLELKNGKKESHAFNFDEDGKGSSIEDPPPIKKFKRSLWSVKRSTRCDVTSEPRQIKNMLDAPFYSRAAVETTLDGRKTTGVFEALDLHRFRNPLILAMLAVRVPRRRRWVFK